MHINLTCFAIKVAFLISSDFIPNTHKNCSKSYKPHPEKKSHSLTCCGNTTSYCKTRKTNSGFCLNFSAGKINTKVKGVQQT